MTNLPVISSENGLGTYLQEVNAIPSLTPEEEFMYAKHYLENQDLDAAHKLVRSHLKLVVKIAMRYRNYGLPVTDLVSEGNIGLMQAVKKFDPDLGFRLSTYSSWWIKAAIQEYILKSWSLVKIGTTAAQKKLFFTLNKVKNKISSLYEREVRESDYDEIASNLGVSRKEAVEMDQRLAGNDISLNTPARHDEQTGTEMMDLLPSTQISQEESLSQQQIAHNKSQILASAMSTLNEREAKILASRKLTDKPATLDVLSQKYAISKERVRQIENKAFEKIRAYITQRITEDGQLKSVGA